jgi:hypothetical protein
LLVRSFEWHSGDQPWEGEEAEGLVEDLLRSWEGDEGEDWKDPVVGLVDHEVDQGSVHLEGQEDLHPEDHEEGQGYLEDHEEGQGYLEDHEEGQGYLEVHGVDQLQAGLRGRLGDHEEGQRRVDPEVQGSEHLEDHVEDPEGQHQEDHEEGQRQGVLEVPEVDQRQVGLRGRLGAQEGQHLGVLCLEDQQEGHEEDQQVVQH